MPPESLLRAVRRRSPVGRGKVSIGIGQTILAGSPPILAESRAPVKPAEPRYRGGQINDLQVIDHLASS
jgi:hypothetical protein